MRDLSGLTLPLRRSQTEIKPHEDRDWEKSQEGTNLFSSRDVWKVDSNKREHLRLTVKPDRATMFTYA